MVWLGLDLDEYIGEGGLARGASNGRDDKSDGEKPKAPHPADFPQGGEEPPHGISLISIWAPTKGSIRRTLGERCLRVCRFQPRKH